MKQVLSGVLFALLVWGMCSHLTVNVYANSHTKALTHPAIEVRTKADTSDVAYSFAFAANEKSRIRPFGNTGKIVTATSDATSATYEYYDSKWMMPSNSENGKVGFWVENVGIYKGDVIDLKITYSWINKVSSDGLEYKPSIGLILCKDGRIGMNFNTRAYEANAEIYSNGQKKTIDKLSFTFGDIDDYQFFGFRPVGEVQEIQCSADSTVYYKKVGDIHFMYADTGGYADTPNASLRFELNNVSGYEFIIGKADAYGDYGLTNNVDGFSTERAFDPNSEGAKYWYNIWAECFNSWGTTVTETKLTTDLNARNQGYAWGYFTGHSYSKYEVSTPTKSVSDTNEIEVISNTLESKGEGLTYRVTHFVPEAWQEFYFKSYEITDTLPACLEVSADKVKVLDTAKRDVTNKFNLKVEGQKVSIQAKVAELAKAAFYAQTYEVVIDTKIKPGADLTPFYSAQINGIEFTNKATVVIDGESKDSNIVKTKLTEKPGELTKKIVVDGRLVDEHAVKAVPETITFRGTIQVTDLKIYKSYQIVDELYPYLSYKNMRVFSENGTDITKQGNAKAEGQKVTFTFNADYLKSLAGQKIYFELEAVLDSKEGFTNLKNGKIPNTFDVVTEDGPRKSNEVNLLPPIVENEIWKSILLPDGSEVERHTLAEKQEDIVFKGDVTIQNTQAVTSLILEDELHQAFMYQPESLHVFDREGKEITEHGEIQVDGQMVRFTFDKEYVPKLIDTKITWTLTVNYIGGVVRNIEIPNTMTLLVNEDVLLTPPVFIMPPEEEDVIVKSIVLPDYSEVERHALLDNEEDIVFQGVVEIGNHEEIKSVILEDDLHQAFAYQKGSLQVFNRMGEDITEHGNLHVEGQKIRFVFEEKYAATLVSSEILWRLTVNYVEGFDLAEVKSGEIPNTMKLIVNERETDSNEVVVVPKEPELILATPEKRKAAKTGDVGNMRVWIAIAGVAIAIIMVVVRRYKSRNF